MSRVQNGRVDRSVIPDLMAHLGRSAILNEGDAEYVALLDSFIAALSRLYDGRIRDKERRERERT